MEAKQGQQLRAVRSAPWGGVGCAAGDGARVRLHTSLTGAALDCALWAVAPGASSVYLFLLEVDAKEMGSLEAPARVGSSCEPLKSSRCLSCHC